MRAISVALTCLGLFLCGVFFGGTREFSYLPVFFVFALGFAAALVSGDACENLKKTLKFPVFIAGVLFCAYIGIQHLNPWMTSVFKYGVSDFYYKDFIIFLPSGVDAINQSMFSDSAIAITVLTCVFAACSLNLIIRNYSDCMPFCAAILLGGIGCCIAGFIEFFSHDRVYSVWNIFDRGMSGRPYGSFFSSTQGGFYIAITLVVAFALFARFVFSRNSKIPVPAVIGIFAPLICVILGAVLICPSFGGLILGLLVFGLIVLILAFYSFGRLEGAAKISIVAIPSALLVAAMAVLFIHPEIMGERINRKIDSLMRGDIAGEVDGGRSDFYEISVEMIRTGGYFRTDPGAAKTVSKLFFGNGANSYGNVAAVYLAADPRFASIDHVGREKSAMLSYAHCDPLQLLFEFGLLWCTVFAGFFAYWLYSLFRAKFWRSAFLAVLVLPVPIALAYSCADIIFYNPFISTVLLSVAVISHKYAQYMRGAKPA